MWWQAVDWVRVIDAAGLVLGLVYVWLEYRASIWLWLVGVVMPVVHGYLYYARGLYADFGMEAYYVVMAVYGYAVWRWGKRGSEAERPITHVSRRFAAVMAVVFVAAWAAIGWFLTRFTDSTVPTLDSMTTALSLVATWALAHKHVEQWLLWLVVDAVSAGLYFYKQIPFTAALYVFYTVMAVAGYVRWNRLARAE